jgi:hypothetical protein
MTNKAIENIHNKMVKNMYMIQFKPNVKTPFKIIEYIALYANNMQILDVVRTIKTTDSVDETYWRVYIQADEACFRNLQNYLDE